MNFRDPEVLGPLIGVAILIVVMGFRLAGAGKAKPLKLEFMWILPVWLVAITTLLLWQMPPRGLEWLWLSVAFAAGAALGWQRGRMMQITIDPQTHALNQLTSRAALIFLLALVVVRLGLRSVLTEEAAALHLSAAFLTDVFVVFAVGMLGVTRLEMFLRARKLLADARAAQARAA
ncbi:MAG: DUF1453 family protein [Caulobacter sp.]|nr:DUF1453 family protein [Caulobacter sp.]